MWKDKLRKEWEKSINPKNYEKGRYSDLIGTENSPLGSVRYAESEYELDSDKTFDWIITRM